MLLRFDPFNEFDRLTRGMDPGSRHFMAADGYRDEDVLVLHLDLPGIDPEAIDLTVEKNTLTVVAGREWVRPENIQLVMQERPTGTFTRRFILGDGLDMDQVDAGYEHGVLTIKIPVREQAKARKITVGSGDLALTG